MKNLTIVIIFLIGIISVSCSSDTGADNTLTRQESKDGWILLFDGETTNGWRGYNRDAFPATGWTIEDGTLACISGRLDRSQRGGDIIFDEKFLDFHLKLDWKIAEGGNSGLFYLGQETRRGIAWTAPEFQLLDNERHPDALQGRDDNRKSASLYDILPAVPQNCNPAGEWNQAEVIIKDSFVTHRQNGVDVVTFQLGTAEWFEMVSLSKFNGVQLFGMYVPGFIGLQDHGDDIWFKNIKIKPL
jgi:hypothetical protein